MLQKKINVTGIGCAAWDLLAVLGNYPLPGEKSKLKLFEEQCGGQVGTALVAVSRLGGRTAIIETTGDDLYGEKIRESLIHEGLDVTYLLKDPGKTSLVSFCAILEETGERAIFFTTGTKRYLELEDIPFDLINNSSCLLVDNHHGKASVVASAHSRETGIFVVTDIERDNPYNDELFRYGTHHILPKDYLIKYTGVKSLKKALITLQKTYNSEVVIATLGEKGSMAFTGKDFITETAYRVESVVDTTGAGDVFHGTFAYGLTLGYSLETNLKFASLVAGLKCRAIGGQQGIPYIDEIKGLFVG